MGSEMGFGDYLFELGKGYQKLATWLGTSLIGLALVIFAVLLPSSRDFLVFQVLLASLGVFVILFGRAARMPAVTSGR